MGWDEWERLKAAAAGRQSAHMQLNHVPNEPGSGSSDGSGTTGRMRSDKAAWSKAGESVGNLRDDLGKALGKLEGGQARLGKGAHCLTAAAQKGVYDSWEHRMKDLSAFCDGLADVLEKAGHDQLRTDESIKAAIARLTVGSKNTPASDGKDR